jgi:high-affinity nickel permease
LSCALLGLRHGIDWDHVAAISDITSVQTRPRDAARCGLLYAAGHAATVAALGIAAILFQRSLPAEISGWMGRIVGLTLVILGIYVLGVVVRGSNPVSRGQALLSIFDWVQRRGREGDSMAPADSLEQPCVYGSKSALGIGVIHGIGAETPTQLAVFLLAANLGGVQKGMLGLAAFTMAMLVSNVLLTAGAMGLFKVSISNAVWFRWLGATTAAYSLWIGMTFFLS